MLASVKDFTVWLQCIAGWARPNITIKYYVLQQNRWLQYLFQYVSMNYKKYISYVD